MNTTSSSLTHATSHTAQPKLGASLARYVNVVVELLSRIPHGLIAFVGRFSIAAVFWLAGQTKIEGLAINIIAGEFTLGWPKLSASALTLFQYEYGLPFIAPVIAAYMAALAEHIFSILILVGLATRFSALALLGMTLVIQTLVYPGAYATHGTWATILLYLIATGPGALSVDHWLAIRYAVREKACRR